MSSFYEEVESSNYHRYTIRRLLKSWSIERLESLISSIIDDLCFLEGDSYRDNYRLYSEACTSAVIKRIEAEEELIKSLGSSVKAVKKQLVGHAEFFYDNPFWSGLAIREPISNVAQGLHWLYGVNNRVA
jgi:hypothetical protein